MGWSRMLGVFGLLIIAWALRNVSLSTPPSQARVEAVSAACVSVRSGSCQPLVEDASAKSEQISVESTSDGGSGACDDFNESTRGDAWHGDHCVGLAIDDGTDCAASCGACRAGDCVADPEREGMTCVDGFGAGTVGDVCRSLSGIAICLGDVDARSDPGDEACAGGCDAAADAGSGVPEPARLL